MTAQPKVAELEQALVNRAQTLAQEYLARGQSMRDKIIQDANDRLRLREEREMLAAKAEAERAFRRRVQASEIRFQEELDQLRWTLVQGVLMGLKKRLGELVQDQKAYRKLLVKLLAQAAAAIEDDDLLVQLNVADHEAFASEWASLAKDAAPGKRIGLEEEPGTSSGGPLVRTTDGNIQVDNTFEGRLERLENELQRVVIERLFAATTSMGTLFHG